MKLQSLRDLLEDQLKDLYSAESQIIKALPKMARAASSEELRAGFEQHLEETRDQLERLERVCDDLEMSPKGKKCAAIEGLVEEGKELMSEDAEPEVLDAGLIGAAQKVEHYEIASYGCARAWALQLGLNDAARLLEQTLEEEKATDQKLNDLAEQMINQQAQQPASQGSGRGGSRRKAGAKR